MKRDKPVVYPKDYEQPRSWQSIATVAWTMLVVAIAIIAVLNECGGGLP